MIKTSKQKGDIAELLVAQSAIDNGYRVAFPFNDDWKVDLIIYKNNKYEGVQVKYLKSKGRNAQITFRASNKDIYTKKDVDWIVAYDVITLKLIYIDMHKIKGKPGSIMIRYDKPKNGQKKNIRYYEDYCRWARSSVGLEQLPSKE